jgi:hypothetical protein
MEHDDMGRENQSKEQGEWRPLDSTNTQNTYPTTLNHLTTSKTNPILVWIIRKTKETT